MGTKKPKRIHKVKKHVIRHKQKTVAWYRDQHIIHRIIIWFFVILMVFVSCAYGVARWYQYKHSKEPLVIGATYIPSYARYYGLDERETLQAMINDLGIKRFRLVSYWNIHEPKNNKYDFSELDWQFNMIEQAGGEVSLSIGLRQPRWPECHWPNWAKEMPQEQWQNELNEYIAKVVKRYRDKKILTSYQLENEYFLDVFGECPDHTRERLVSEFNLVKSIDSSKPLIVTRSNNAVPSWPVGEPRSDINGASIYKRVWDRTITKRYFEYPLPAWFYGFLAGGAELTTGRDTFIHEMQTEPWPPNGMLNATIEEQDKSFNADKMYDRINFGVATGMKTIDLWGVEWWYWRKINQNDDSVWEAGKGTIKRLRDKHGISDSQY